MKKRLVSRCLSFGLALAVTAGLCACGGGGSEADPDLAKENVYRMKEIELPQLYNPESGNMNVLASAVRDGKINLLVWLRDWSAEVYNEYDYRLISMNEDGSDAKVTPLEIPDVGVGEEGGDTPAVDEPVEEPEDETADTPPAPEEEGETGDEAAAVEESGGGISTLPAGPIARDTAEEGVETNISEYTNYSGFSMMADGTVYARKNHRIEDWSDPDNYIAKNETSICCWDSEGKMLLDISLGEQDDYTWVNSVLEGADNALYVMLSVNSEDYSTTDYYRVRVGLDGSIGQREKVSEDSMKLFTNSDQMISRGDGTAFISFRDETDWTKMYYTTYDVAADKAGEIKDFPSSISYTYDYNVMLPGRSHQLIYTGNAGIYYWDEGAETGQLMMDYVNSDMYIESMYGMVELDDSSFLGLFMEDWNSGMKAGIFTYVAPEDIQDKKVLVMAGEYIDTDLKKRVIEYNRNNPDYRIVLKEYNSYNSYDDYSAGTTKLNNDVISGNMPDILVCNSGGSLPVGNYIAKGLIADIDKLIEQDEELSQVEFMQNAFDAYRVNGKLYYIVPDFEIYTVIAKKSLVGDRESWTMEDVQQVVAGMGDNAKAFSGDITRNSFMNMVMRYCGNQFVDVSTGKCAFNTDDFISMMEYAKSLPSDDQSSSGYDEEYWQEYWNTYESQYRQNRTLLLEANFWRFDNLAYTINGRIGEAVSYTGFPTESGNGSYIMSSRTYVLSAKSKNLDEAWNFMRYYLTEEVQKEVNYLPVRKDIFYENSKRATERPTYEWTDENGETHTEYEDLTIWMNGESVPFDPLSQEQLDELIAFIESVHNPYYYNEEIMNIINEEIDGFFTGQKPAKDVADVIQRRVQNYVDENS